MPKWAQDDPKNFFQAADEYEGVGNRRYMEIEFALPNELKTVEQYRQIIDAFIAKHLKDHYYAYAIHNKIGVMSEGQHHPHVHIMFFEQVTNEVGKKMKLGLQNFFIWCIKRYLLRAFAYWERPSGVAESERLCCVYRQMFRCRVVLSDKEATAHWWRPTVAHQTTQAPFRRFRTATEDKRENMLCGVRQQCSDS